jgi:hypothetical protein
MNLNKQIDNSRKNQNLLLPVESMQTQSIEERGIVSAQGLMKVGPARIEIPSNYLIFKSSTPKN